MKNFKSIISSLLVCVILLGGSVFAPAKAEAKATFPSETDPFVANHYVDPINQDAPFFDTILPAIEKNIKENNKHSISPYYDKMPRANNPENFQGLGSTTYANINGKKVTAEAFYRLTNESLHDPNCGMGLLIYQCIQYKRAHPEEDVKITFSSYRTSVTASVCVLPESKYYGYMRSLYGVNYDEHGFVRISYMLTEAARMGIEVTLVNQLNSYAVKQYNPNTKKLQSRKNLSLHTYFAQATEGDCYEKYAPGKKVADFMNCANVGWNVGDKTGDMQHVKSASVSHYLATDGTEHTSAVYYGSANLDENNYIGANGNNSSQSGVIVSDHDELYRVNYNYIQLMADYKEQEQLFELRKLVNEKNNEQLALITAGRADEIPSDEQILYLGTENDPVFELYFTPFGGSADNWDTENNPFCKYVDKLPASEDYVEFTWNEFGYGSCNIGKTMEKKLAQAFCDNPDPRNKFSIRVTDFNTDEIQKLKLGAQIGYRSIKDGKNIHSKDMLMSYKENGVRHNVSLLTSCNFYMIAFSYRTNSMLVINETEQSGGNFYRIMGKKYSYGMLDSKLMVDTPNVAIDTGASFTVKAHYTGSKTLTWSSANKKVATVSKKGKIKAVAPGQTTITVTDGTYKATVKVTVAACGACLGTYKGFTGNLNEQYVLSKNYETLPLTFESVFTLNQNDLNTTKTLLGSNDNFEPTLSYEINKKGYPQVRIRTTAGNKTTKTYTFKKANVATGEKVHLSITINPESKKMYCFVNGKKVQTVSISALDTINETYLPVIGGDHVGGNATAFPGVIDSITLWKDLRTSAEISKDYQNGVNLGDVNLMAAFDFTRCAKCRLKDQTKSGYDLKRVVLWQDAADVAPVGDYEYSFAVVGDTQTMCERDPAAMDALYSWILDNKDDQKIEYVIGLGDITDNSTDGEWEHATEYIAKLNGNLPYLLARGNHDDLDDFNRHFNNGYYENTVDGVMKEGDLTNSYRYFSIQGTDYLLLTLDFAPSSEVLKWADSVISAHPDHKVIAVTHAYMYRDGTTLDAGDCYPPSYYQGYTDAQNGDDMWNKCFSKHENVLMVLSGHDPWQNIVYRQDKGENGNLVTQMLVDAQYVDLHIGSTAMVAMFYFSNEGKTLTVRYYSVAKDCYGSVASQFTIDLNTHTHTFGDFIYNDDATKYNDGTKSRACSSCDVVETVTAKGTKLAKTLVNTSKKFKDVPASAWYKPHVDYATTYGIFNGTSATTFSPNEKITRAQFVQMLANLSGIDTSNNQVSSGFSDVKKGKWYTAAVTWGAKAGVINGVGGGKFEPETNVTREQMCVILVNYMERYREDTLRSTKKVAAFSDDARISSWAKNAVYACAKAGLVNGVGNNLFDPQSPATRAEGATILSNFHKTYILP